MEKLQIIIMDAEILKQVQVLLYTMHQVKKYIK